MNEFSNKARNITPKGERRRRVSGIIASIIGILLGMILLWQEMDRWWRLVLFVPFVYGGLGLFQAREKT